MRLKKIGVVLFLMIFSTLTAKEVGDTISFYVNNFRLILNRDTLPQVGVVRFKGRNFYIVSADRVAIIKIGKFHIGNSYNKLWIGSKRLPGQDPAYIYNSSDGENWIWERGLSGMDLKVDRYIRGTGDTVVVADMDIHDFTYVDDSLQAIKAVIFAATSDGLFSSIFTQTPGAWKLEAFADTIVYGLAVNYQTRGFGARGQVIYAATAFGVYRVETQGFNSSSSYTLKGTLTDTVYAICEDPSDSSRLLIGASSGVYRWQNNDWDSLNVNFGRVYHIRFDSISGRFYVAADSGLFVTQDYGNSWRTLGQFEYPVTDVILDGDTIYVSLLGGGVFKSSDNGTTWQDFSNGLETLRLLGSKNVYTIYNDDGKLYLGCDEGIYRYSDSLSMWENVSNGVGSLMTDRSVATVASLLENDSVSVLNTIISKLKINPNDLVDIDNDPRVYVILTRLVQTSNATDPTVIPVYGYFDPRDEEIDYSYSTKREVIVVDLSKFIVSGSINQSKLQAFISYLIGRYAVWSLDMNAHPAEITGIAAWASYKCGFDFADGVSGGISYLGNKKYLNSPLLDYTHQWLNSPVAREIDRERMLLWFDYLSQLYGDTIITKDVLHGGLRGYRSLDRIIKKYTNGKDSLPLFAQKWYLALTFNRTLYLTNLDGSMVDTVYGFNPPMDTIHVKSDAISDLPSADEQKTPQVMAPAGFSVWRDVIQDTTGVRFNTRDGDQNYLSIFVVCGGDSIAHVISMDSLGRFSLTFTPDTCSAFKFLIANSNVNKTISYYISEDTTAPHVVGSYALQNPGNPRFIQMYLSGYDKVGSKFYGLMSDVNVPAPVVTFSTLTDSPIVRNYALKLLNKGDSVYNYFTPISLDLNGDILISVKAQDLAGNEAEVSLDTISMQSITSDGGTILALDGDVIINVPSMTFISSTPLLIDKINKDYAERTFKGADSGTSDVFVIGNDHLIGNRDVTITLKSPIMVSNLSVYRYEDGDWRPVPTYIVGDNSYVFKTRKFGVFQLRKGASHRMKFNFSILNGSLVLSTNKIELAVVLPQSDKVNIDIYNSSGRLVKRVYHGKMKTGYHVIYINTSILTPGVYFIKFEAPNRKSVKKMIYLR